MNFYYDEYKRSKNEFYFIDWPYLVIYTYFIRYTKIYIHCSKHMFYYDLEGSCDYTAS